MVGCNYRYLDCASQQAFKIRASFCLMHGSKYLMQIKISIEMCTSPCQVKTKQLVEWHSQWHEMGWTFINLSVHTNCGRSMLWIKPFWLIKALRYHHNFISILWKCLSKCIIHKYLIFIKSHCSVYVNKLFTSLYVDTVVLFDLLCRCIIMLQCTCNHIWYMHNVLL